MTGPVPFVKATACGNDFIIIDAERYAPADLEAFTRAICHRSLGVGADGVEWVYPAESPESDLRIKLINADGSHAEISGNGTRCVAAWVADTRGLTSPRIATDAGIKLCELTHRERNYFEFKTAMGVPDVGSEVTLQLASGAVTGLEVSMGNPHYVMFVDGFKSGWQLQAAEIQANKHFPNSTNVELVRVVGEQEIEIRIFERGCGETMSSGTGSSASAVATIATKRARSPLQVHAPGGRQIVRWEDQVLLSGPAQIICRGEYLG